MHSPQSSVQYVSHDVEKGRQLDSAAIAQDRAKAISETIENTIAASLENIQEDTKSLADSVSTGIETIEKEIHEREEKKTPKELLNEKPDRKKVIQLEDSIKNSENFIQANRTKEEQATDVFLKEEKYPEIATEKEELQDIVEIYPEIKTEKEAHPEKTYREIITGLVQKGHEKDWKYIGNLKSAKVLLQTITNKDTGIVDKRESIKEKIQKFKEGTHTATEEEFYQYIGNNMGEIVLEAKGLIDHIEEIVKEKLVDTHTKKVLTGMKKKLEELQNMQQHVRDSQKDIQDKKKHAEKMVQINNKSGYGKKMSPEEIQELKEKLQTKKSPEKKPELEYLQIYNDTDEKELATEEKSHVEPTAHTYDNLYADVQEEHKTQEEQTYAVWLSILYTRVIDELKSAHIETTPENIDNKLAEYLAKGHPKAVVLQVMKNGAEQKKKNRKESIETYIQDFFENIDTKKQEKNTKELYLEIEQIRKEYNTLEGKKEDTKTTIGKILGTLGGIVAYKEPETYERLKERRRKESLAEKLGIEDATDILNREDIQIMEKKGGIEDMRKYYTVGTYYVDKTPQNRNPIQVLQCTEKAEREGHNIKPAKFNLYTQTTDGTFIKTEENKELHASIEYLYIMKNGSFAIKIEKSTPIQKNEAPDIRTAHFESIDDVAELFGMNTKELHERIKGAGITIATLTDLQENDTAKKNAALAQIAQAIYAKKIEGKKIETKTPEKIEPETQNINVADLVDAIKNKKNEKIFDLSDDKTETLDFDFEEEKTTPPIIEEQKPEVQETVPQKTQLEKTLEAFPESLYQQARSVGTIVETFFPKEGGRLSLVSKDIKAKRKELEKALQQANTALPHGREGYLGHITKQIQHFKPQSSKDALAKLLQKTIEIIETHPKDYPLLQNYVQKTQEQKAEVQETKESGATTLDKITKTGLTRLTALIDPTTKTRKQGEQLHKAAYDLLIQMPQGLLPRGHYENIFKDKHSENKVHIDTQERLVKAVTLDEKLTVLEYILTGLLGETVDLHIDKASARTYDDKIREQGFLGEYTTAELSFRNKFHNKLYKDIIKNYLSDTNLQHAFPLKGSMKLVPGTTYRIINKKGQRAELTVTETGAVKIYRFEKDRFSEHDGFSIENGLNRFFVCEEKTAKSPMPVYSIAGIEKVEKKEEENDKEINENIADKIQEHIEKQPLFAIEYQKKDGEINEDAADEIQSELEKAGILSSVNLAKSIYNLFVPEELQKTYTQKMFVTKNTNETNAIFDLITKESFLTTDVLENINKILQRETGDELDIDIEARRNFEKEE